jgi:hypothetical protein
MPLVFSFVPLCQTDEEMQALLPHRLHPAVLG